MCLGISAATAAIAGGALAAGGAIGGAIISGNAATGAGNAQILAQQQALQQEIAQRQQTIQQASAAGTMSPGEINSTNQILTTRDQQLATQLAQVQQQQDALSKIDPNVQAAGKDLYNLLTGKAADTLAPLQTQLDKQRSNLVSQLQSQLGPGYATSSAGIQALTSFDQSAAVTVSQAQQSAIQTATQTYGSLFGAQQAGSNSIASNTANAFGAAQAASGTALNEYGNVANRSENAILGGSGVAPINYQAPAGVAANPFAGQGVLGGGIAGAAQSIGQGFGQAAGFNSFGQLLDKVSGGGGAAGSNLTAQIPQIPQFSIGSVNSGSGNSFSIAGR